MKIFIIYCLLFIHVNMCIFIRGFWVSIWVSGIRGFGFGDGFPPESVSGSGSDFGFGCTETPPDPNPTHCHLYPLVDIALLPEAKQWTWELGSFFFICLALV